MDEGETLEIITVRQFPPIESLSNLEKNTKMKIIYLVQVKYRKPNLFFIYLPG